MNANPRLLIVFAATQFVLFPIPIVTVFWTDQIGMSLTDVVLLQALFSLAVVLFEFPSGYFADRVGYRKSLLVGTILSMAGWCVYVGGASFATVALAEVVLGAGRPSCQAPIARCCGHRWILKAAPVSTHAGRAGCAPPRRRARR
jgi:MFS family permease